MGPLRSVLGVLGGFGADVVRAGTSGEESSTASQSTFRIRIHWRVGVKFSVKTAAGGQLAVSVGR